MELRNHITGAYSEKGLNMSESKQGKNQMSLYGERIILKQIRAATRQYVNWLNDVDVNSCLESRFTKQTMETCQDFINNANSDTNTYFYGIYVKDTHVGNIKLHVNPKHNYGDIGYLIGREYWGKGYATESIKTIVKFAFDVMELNKVWAGVYETNIGSIKALTKAGFIEEGRQKRHYLSEGKYMDGILMAIWR